MAIELKPMAERFLLIGGTGTLGNELALQLLAENENRIIRVFSRDELKQQQMKKRFPHAEYVVGDIRDRRSIHRAMSGCDHAFMVAAMKHIDVVEANPMEAIKTNIIGLQNCAEAAGDHNLKTFVFSSTDKAVEPVNTYGHTKAIGERYILGLNKLGPTSYSVFRWGNVLGSRGSVLHAFQKTLMTQGRVYLTDPEMTRFWIHIEDAVKFMLRHYRTPLADRPMIPPMRAAKVINLAAATAKVLGVRDWQYEVIGIRPGEKIHEKLTEDLASNTAEQISQAELIDMVGAVL